MSSYWVQFAPIDGVPQHEIERIAADLEIKVVSSPQQDATWQTALGESLEPFAPSLASMDRLFAGPAFRAHYGVGLDATQRLARARTYAESGLPYYLELDPLCALIAGARDEDERVSLAQQCNAWLADAPLDEHWVHDGALLAATRTGRVGIASFGAQVSLAIGSQHALRVARWLGEDPARLPSVRSIWLSGKDLAGALAILEALGQREVETLKIPALKPRDLATLLAKLPPGVRGVNAHYAKLGAPLSASLTQSPAWPALRALDLHRNELKSKGLATLLTAAHPAPIESLDLGYNALKSADFAALAKASWARDLRSLRVKYNDAKARGAQAFFAHADLSSLRVLDFGANEIGDAGVAAMVANPSLTSLESLSIEGNGRDPLVTARGAAMLAQWAGASGVRSLNLAQNRIGNEGLLALLQSPRWAALAALDLQYCGLDATLARALDDVQTEARPRTVTLMGNAVGAALAAQDEGPQEPWARAWWLSECRSLNLYNTALTLETLLQIAHSPALSKLRSLTVSSNAGLSNDALERLLDAPLGQRIEHLELLYWPWTPGAAKRLSARHAQRPFVHLSLSAAGLDERELLELRCALGPRLSLS